MTSFLPCILESTNWNILRNFTHTHTHTATGWEVRKQEVICTTSGGGEGGRGGLWWSVPPEVIEASNPGAHALTGMDTGTLDSGHGTLWITWAQGQTERMRTKIEEAKPALVLDKSKLRRLKRRRKVGRHATRMNIFIQPRAVSSQCAVLVLGLDVVVTWLSRDQTGFFLQHLALSWITCIFVAINRANLH